MTAIAAIATWSESNLGRAMALRRLSPSYIALDDTMSDGLGPSLVADDSVEHSISSASTACWDEEVAGDLEKQIITLEVSRDGVLGLLMAFIAYGRMRLHPIL